MLQVSFYEVRDEQVDQLRSWMRQLAQRKDEVLETFAAETTRQEAAYLLQGRDGQVLVYVMEVGDSETAHRIFAESRLPIDVQHKRILEAVIAGVADVELLFECP